MSHLTLRVAQSGRALLPVPDHSAPGASHTVERPNGLLRIDLGHELPALPAAAGLSCPFQSAGIRWFRFWCSWLNQAVGFRSWRQKPQKAPIRVLHGPRSQLQSRDAPKQPRLLIFTNFFVSKAEVDRQHRLQAGGRIAG